MKSTCLSWSYKEDRKKLIQLLEDGGIVVGPSDTVIGLLAHATHHGVQKLNEIKKRTEKPYIILVNSIEQVERFAHIPDNTSVKKIMQSCWPGPLTLILKARHGLQLYPENVKTVALRIPSHEGLLDILQHLQGFLSTSANLAGEPIPTSMQNIDQEIIKKVDGCIDDNDFTTTPSTILDCSGDRIILVREGAYTVEEIEKSIGSKITKS